MTNPSDIAEQIRRLNEEGLRKLCYILHEDNMADKLSATLNMVFSEVNQDFNLSLEEACEIAKVDYRTILHHARKNSGVARKVFGRWYISEKRLRDLMQGVPAESIYKANNLIKGDGSE
tara:strand:+ start:228 stop:584 length:357 start_codon:yes stop_codon:yes gene_type:complete